MIESLLLRGAQCRISGVVIRGTFVDPLVALNRMHRRWRAVILLLVKTNRILQVLKRLIVRIQNRLKLFLLHLPKGIPARWLLNEIRVPYTGGRGYLGA